MAEYQLTELQYKILKAIDASDQPIGARAIRDQLGLDQRGIGGATRAILHRDYVTIIREGNVASGYDRFYTITALGREAMAAYEVQPREMTQPGWQEWQQRFDDEYRRVSANYQTATGEPNPLSFVEWMDEQTDFAGKRSSAQISYDFWQQRHSDMAKLIGYMSAALEEGSRSVKHEVARNAINRALTRYQEWANKLKRK